MIRANSSNKHLRSLVGRLDVQDTICINFEDDLNLRNTARRRRDTVELELAEKIVVLREGPFTLVNLDQHGLLVVSGRGEDLALASGNDGVAGNEFSHDTADGLNTEGKGIGVNEDDVAEGLVTGENTALDGSTVRDSLVGVDRLVRLLAVEEVGNKLDDTWDTSGTANENDLVDLGLVDLRIAEDSLNRLESAAEEILAKFLQAGTGKGHVEVDTLEEGVDFDGNLGSRRKGALSTLASRAETTEGAEVGREVYEKEEVSKRRTRDNCKATHPSCYSA